MSYEKLLLFDEDKNRLELLKRELSGLGYDIETLTNCNNHSTSVRSSTKFALILLIMTGIDESAIALVECIHQQRRGIPVLVLSSGFGTDLHQLRLLFLAGASNIEELPSHPNDLPALIENSLTRFRSDVSAYRQFDLSTRFV